MCAHVNEVRGQNILLEKILVLDVRGECVEALRFKEVKKGRGSCVGRRLDRGG